MRKLKDLRDHFFFGRMASYRLPSGHRRIYFHHIRRTGGTSLSQMFLLAASGADPSRGDRLWSGLWAAHRHRLHFDGKVFVAGEKKLIEEGRYFYAVSHLPAHELVLPEATYTITCLRDPVKRVLSHYNLLLGERDNGGQAFRKEGHWLGAGFDDFLENIPVEHLLRQLYMFSPNYDPDEAFAAIASCSFWFFTEELPAPASVLSSQVGLDLRPFVANRSSAQAIITQDQMRLLKKLLRPEIELYQRLKAVRRAARSLAA